MARTTQSPRLEFPADHAVGGHGSIPTGRLQSPRFPQAIQEPAILSNLEADLSRVGEGRARGLEQSEVRVSHVGKGAWCGPPAPAPLRMRFVSAQALTLATLPTRRLPDLTTVISVDDPLPGTLLLKEVVAAGGEERHRARLQYSQQFLSCHDPINIQFTSVGQRPPGPAPRLASPCPPWQQLPQMEEMAVEVQRADTLLGPA